MAVRLKIYLVLALILPSVLGEPELQNIAAQCSCPIKHPQEKICRADIVIQGRVIEVTSSGTGLPGMGSLLEYTIKATKIYKGLEHTIRGKRIKMITSSSSGKCGVTEMDIGEKYILTGLDLEGEVFFSICEWVERFTELTSDQRRGLKSQGYIDGCSSCLIDQRENSLPGIHDNPSPAANICLHDPLGSAHLLIEDCESMFSICVPAEGNQCSWTQSKRYSKCVAKRLKKYTAKEVMVTRNK